MEYTSCQRIAFQQLIHWWENSSKQYFELAGLAGCMDIDSTIFTDHGLLTIRQLMELNGTDLSLREFEHFKPNI